MKDHELAHLDAISDRVKAAYMQYQTRQKHTQIKAVLSVEIQLCVLLGGQHEVA